MSDQSAIHEASGGQATGREPNTRSTAATTVSTLLTYALIIVCALVPTPYLIEMPGPVFNTLGQNEGEDVLTISGARTYPTTGQLDMLTVGVAGGPGRKIYPSQALWSVVKGRDTVIPSETYYPLTTTRDEVAQVNAQQMSSSQDTAVAAALNEMGTKYSTRLGISQVVKGAPAEGILQAGDFIDAVNGESITGSAEDITRLQDLVATGNEVTMEITRDDSERTVSVRPAPSEGGAKLGIVLAPAYDFPIDVKFNLDDVGGPSAGLVFALTIIDKLEPGDMTGGVKIAGTGAITADGQVQPIGGARQKVIAASQAGNQYFLSPTDNCAEALAAARGRGIDVVRIDNLDTAVQAVDEIAHKSTDNLPTCSTQG